MILNKFLFILSIFISASIFAHADRTQHFTFQNLLSIDGSCPAKSLRVIDKRTDKTSIGFIKGGILDKKQPLTTENSFADFLSTHFAKMTAGSKKGEEELILVLHHIEVRDKMEREVGTFYFDGEFYRGANGNYAYLGALDTFIEVGDALDITKNLLLSVEDNLQKALSRFASLPVNNRMITLQETDITTRRNKERQKYPVYNTTEYKKGICYTLEQFLNNTPVDTPFVRSTLINPGSIYIPLFYTNAKGKKLGKIDCNTFFAAYDGVSWVLGNGGRGGLMEFKENDFYSYAELVGKNGMDDIHTLNVMSPVVAIMTVASNKKEMKTTYQVRFDPERKVFVPVARTY